MSLADYIARSRDIPGLSEHRRAFKIGSILPDCKPSFITTKHEFSGTFDKVSDRMELLLDTNGKYRRHGWKYYMDLGQVTHYLADYFTYPHNSNYPGGFKDHCVYEKIQMRTLRGYINSGMAERDEIPYKEFVNLDALLDFIRAKHAEYMRQSCCVEGDISYIVNLCEQVVEALNDLMGAAVVATA